MKSVRQPSEEPGPSPSLPPLSPTQTPQLTMFRHAGQTKKEGIGMTTPPTAIHDPDPAEGEVEALREGLDEREDGRGGGEGGEGVEEGGYEVGICELGREGKELVGSEAKGEGGREDVQAGIMISWKARLCSQSFHRKD